MIAGSVSAICQWDRRSSMSAHRWLPVGQVKQLAGQENLASLKGNLRVMTGNHDFQPWQYTRDLGKINSENVKPGLAWVRSSGYGIVSPFDCSHAKTDQSYLIG